MKLRPVLVIFSLASLSVAPTAASVANGKAFVTHSPLPSSLDILSEKQLSVRGGAGPIDKNVAAQIFTGCALASGLFTTLAPEQNLTAYGVNDDRLVITTLMRQHGAWVLSVGVIGYCLFVQGTSKNTAFGYAFAVHAVQGLILILNGVPEKIFPNNTPAKKLMNYAAICMHAVAAYVLLSRQEYASKLVSIWGYFGLLNSAVGIVAPAKFAEAWGIDEQTAMDLNVKSMHRILGFGILAFTVIWFALESGKEPFEAFGYSIAVLFAELFSDNFVTKDMARLGAHPFEQYFWLVVMAILGGTILF